ncbi:MAG: helix-turn-helix domain-containing protein [Coprococcus sp.]
MIDQVKIGNFLRKLRKEKGMTQEEIATKFGVSSRSVSRWENGNTMPDLAILVELADYYDVDIREIIDGERKSENMEKRQKKLY